MDWRERFAVDVPCRPASTVDRSEPIAPGDPRFSDGIVIITAHGRYVAQLREGRWDPHGVAAGPAPVRPGDTVDAVGRRMAAQHALSLPIVDAAELPRGVLGWDDLVRFALAQGALDACWRAPASVAARPDLAITPAATWLDLGRPTTLHDAASAIVQRATRRLGAQPDAIQFQLPGGLGSPADLLRALFGPHQQV